MRSTTSDSALKAASDEAVRGRESWALRLVSLSILNSTVMTSSLPAAGRATSPVRKRMRARRTWPRLASARCSLAFSPRSLGNGGISSTSRSAAPVAVGEPGSSVEGRGPAVGEV